MYKNRKTFDTLRDKEMYLSGARDMLQAIRISTRNGRQLILSDDSEMHILCALNAARESQEDKKRAIIREFLDTYTHDKVDLNSFVNGEREDLPLYDSESMRSCKFPIAVIDRDDTSVEEVIRYDILSGSDKTAEYYHNESQPGGPLEKYRDTIEEAIASNEDNPLGNLLGALFGRNDNPDEDDDSSDD